jgi:hypothetical protein
MEFVCLLCFLTSIVSRGEVVGLSPTRNLEDYELPDPYPSVCLSRMGACASAGYQSTQTSPVVLGEVPSKTP